MKFLKKPYQKVFKYTVPGEPMPLAKVTLSEGPKMWDAYKQARFHYIQTIKNLHDKYFLNCTFEEGAINRRQYVDGPIKLEATFYMKLHELPKKKDESEEDRKKREEKHNKKMHTKAPPVFSLFNFLDHALQGVLYKKDCTIANVKLKKIYDKEPRTEIKITRLK